MAGYIGVEVEDDPDVLTDAALGALAESLPEFVAREAHLEVQLLEVVSRLNSETRYLFNLVPDSIFRYFGESLLGVLPVEGSPATASTTWTMIDDSGYTIVAGTQVGYRVAGDELIVFKVVADYVVPGGSLSITDVLIEAEVDGIAGNSLGPAGLELVDSLAFVASVTAAATTVGGIDREADDVYLDRLKEELKLLTPSFVLAADAAVLARRITGVHRALGIDNYSPGNGLYTNEKTMTLAVVGPTGLAVSAGVLSDVQTYLNSLRELNFVINVVNPTYVTINVTFTVVALPGYDLVDLDTRATAAIADYLSPANWAGGSEDPPVWRSGATVVRYLEVAEVLNRVDGVDYVSVLTVNSGTANVTLTGVAPLTQAGTIAGTAVSA